MLSYAEPTHAVNESHCHPLMDLMARGEQRYFRVHLSVYNRGLEDFLESTCTNLICLRDHLTSNEILSYTSTPTVMRTKWTSQGEQ
jgi:hypothetical protein